MSSRTTELIQEKKITQTMTVQNIKASVLLGARDIQTISRKISEPVNGEVQVEVSSTTIYEPKQEH